MAILTIFDQTQSAALHRHREDDSYHLATIMHNQALKFADEIAAYLEKIGEMGNSAEANRILGAPTTTLDHSLEITKK